MKEDIDWGKAHKYAEENSSEEPNTLKSLSAYTEREVGQENMLSGHLQGRFLSMISKLKSPQGILEIGTFTGYGTLCLAEGLSPDGELHTIEYDTRRETHLTTLFSESPFAKNISLHIGDAREVIPNLNCKWDLVFIDAAKRQYSTYLDLLKPSLNEGALILADNVLWSGRVYEENPDKRTLALQQYVQYVTAMADMETVLLPLRDGLHMARYRGK